MRLFYFSDDEGSDEDEDEDNDEDYHEDYHEVEEEQQQQQNESPSKVFSNNYNQQKNGFQFGTSTSISSKPEAISGLSNMMAKFDFNINSSFNFGLQSTTTTEVIYINSLILF